MRRDPGLCLVAGSIGIWPCLAKIRDTGNVAVDARVLALRSLPAGWPLILLATLLWLILPLAAQAAVEGTVINRTTGEPVAGVLITLLKFEAGMDPIEEVRSDKNGAFAFQKPLTAANGSPVPGMLRSEYEGVSYSEMLSPGRSTEGIEVSVYSVEEQQVLAPSTHILIFEPGGGEMVIKDVYAFVNQSTPPRAYRDAENGTLRFYLPPEAKGIVQVSASGPQRMPLRSIATPAGEANIYKVDFPIKPGENTIELTYLVPYDEGAEFQSRVLYEDLSTRIAVPAGVEVDADGLVSLGQEPRTQAAIYDLPSAPTFTVKISGQGQLARSGGGAEAAAPSSGNEIRIAQAPVAKEMYWVIGLTAAVLLVGFYYLYTRQPDAAAAGVAATANTDVPKHASSSQPVQRRAPRPRKA